MFSPSNRSSERSMLRDQVIDLDEAAVERLLPAEGEQLSRQDAGAFGGRADLGDVLRFRALHPDVVEQQIAVAEDRGQEIIEVVRDAAGQLAERFHLLRTQHLILQLLALGDVHERADESNGFAIGVPRNDRALEQLRVGSVGALEPIFACPMIALRECVAKAERGARAVVRVNVSLPEADLGASRGRFVTEQIFEALRPGQRAALYIPIPNSIIRSPGSKRKMLRAFRRAIFC